MIILNVVALVANIALSFYYVDSQPYVALFTASGAGWSACWLGHHV